MRYFFDIAIDFSWISGQKHVAWWRRFKAWLPTIHDDSFNQNLSLGGFDVFLDDGMVAITAPIELGVERETLDAITALVQRYLGENVDAKPVGFTYASMAVQKDSESSAPYRRYDGGCIFITKDKIHELVASEQLTELQERLAKNGEF